MEKQKVYLAGGFDSQWRSKIKSLSNVIFFDPQFKPDKHWSEYGTWDIHYIKQCDIVFGYMGVTNPSGYGLSAELGYARALNKTVILVLESGHAKDRYLQFLKIMADVVYDDMDKGIEFLKTF